MNDVQEREPEGYLPRDDEETLIHLFREHGRVLHNYAFRMLRSADRAADAVEAVLLPVARDLSLRRPSAPPAGPLLFSRMRRLLLGRVGAIDAGDEARDVDLWSLVSAPRPGEGTVEGCEPANSTSIAVARGMVGRCGVVSSAVLSMAYFGGYRIAEIAERLSMTPAECRSRLHGCLEHLSGGIQGRHRGTAHEVRFSVCASAEALGAIREEDEPEYFRHRAEGCAQCEEECSTYEGAAHLLAGILPDATPQPELLERLLFALRLSAIADPVGVRAAGVAGPAADLNPGSGDPQPGPEAAGPKPGTNGGRRGRERGSALPGTGRGSVMAVAVAFASILVIATIGWYANTLTGTIDDQANLIDLLHDRQTELVLRNARLEGIARFFESKGLVTVLSGSEDFPGLSGKLVFDTTDGSAMLQIVNLPADLGRSRLTVRAERDDASVPLAEFDGAARDTGAVLYRFFPVAGAASLAAGVVTVEARGYGAAGPGAYHRIMEGNVPLRP